MPVRLDEVCDHPVASRIVWDDREICDDCQADLGPDFDTEDMGQQAFGLRTGSSAFARFVNRNLP